MYSYKFKIIFSIINFLQYYINYSLIFLIILNIDRKIHRLSLLKYNKIYINVIELFKNNSSIQEKEK